MARITLLCRDLLFGSKVEEGLRAAGHEITRFDGDDMARAAVADKSELLIVDLTAEDYDGAILVESMKMGGELEGVRSLGFYAHVDVDMRRRAEQAGFDLVVPRSRMAREMTQLVEKLLA